MRTLQNSRDCAGSPNTAAAFIGPLLYAAIKVSRIYSVAI